MRISTISIRNRVQINLKPASSSILTSSGFHLQSGPQPQPQPQPLNQAKFIHSHSILHSSRFDDPSKLDQLLKPLKMAESTSISTSTSNSNPSPNPNSTSASTFQRPPQTFVRSQMEGLMTKRFFYNQAFEIYGGVAGLYDYGPTGAALQANIITAWRNHFILEEEMLELDTTIMTPYEVLKTSGHVEKFSDFMVKDSKNGDIFRADHLVEGVLEARLKGDKEARANEKGQTTTDKEQGKDSKEDDKKTQKKKKIKQENTKLDDVLVAEYENTLAQIDNYSGPELGSLIQKYQIKSPETGNELSAPVEFNLMFDTQIGPTGQLKGFLRPETAQGHFVNFQRLLEFNNGRVPFASAHIGKSFRNEISPRAGLLRVREFTMAEIEHFVDPLEKNHERFSEVSHVKLRLLPKQVQQAGKTDISERSIGEAVSDGMIDNETLGYFLGRIHLFLIKIGIDPQRLRFRQHMSNEMAHYASDCWDAEILTSYGWIECVGCADRSAYDLSVHAKRTKKDLVVQKMLKKPNFYEKFVVELFRKKLGPHFKKEARFVEQAINELDQETLEKMASQLKNGTTKLMVKELNKEVELNNELIQIEKKTMKETVREFIPNVIEPSFGIGRIFYSLLEHSFWVRGDAKENETKGGQDSLRSVLSLLPNVAPIKALIVPISANKDLSPLAKEVAKKLRGFGIACRIDDSSATIGKRYSRNDELGTPFACTLDFASLTKGTMTLRERDTTSQLIGPIEEVIKVMKELCEGSLTWEGATKRLPAYSGEQSLD